jgi:CheY-like chemotaxis protein
MIESKPALHILIVENNTSDSETIAKLLNRQSTDVRVSVAIDGDEAMALLASFAGFPERQPNLIVLDLGLAGRDGRDILRAIKADPRTKHIPVVVFTGSNRMTDARIAYESGASTFIRKPGDFAGFTRIVDLIREYWTKAAVLPEEEAVSP